MDNKKVITIILAIILMLILGLYFISIGISILFDISFWKALNAFIGIDFGILLIKFTGKTIEKILEDIQSS